MCPSVVAAKQTRNEKRDRSGVMRESIVEVILLSSVVDLRDASGRGGPRV